MTLTIEELRAIAEEELDACATLDAAKLMARELLANREAQPDGWIACRIRMPEPNKYVQVSNGAWVGIGMYSDEDHFEDDERWQDEHNEFIDLLHHPVTHWMPLPAPPQEV